MKSAMWLPGAGWNDSQVVVQLLCGHTTHTWAVAGRRPHICCDGMCGGLLEWSLKWTSHWPVRKSSMACEHGGRSQNSSIARFEQRSHWQRWLPLTTFQHRRSIHQFYPHEHKRSRRRRQQRLNAILKSSNDRFFRPSLSFYINFRLLTVGLFVYSKIRQNILGPIVSYHDILCRIKSYPLFPPWPYRAITTVQYKRN